jgi:hypothetical protein
MCATTLYKQCKTALFCCLPALQTMAKTRTFLRQLSAPPDFVPANLEALSSAAPAAAAAAAQAAAGVPEAANAAAQQQQQQQPQQQQQ